MTKKLQVAMILAVAAVLSAGVAWAEEEQEKVWIAKDGKAMPMGMHHEAMFIGEDGEWFDLADLDDGETRVFGEGDKQLTVNRDGDVVTVKRDESGEEHQFEIKCHVDSDTCKVMTFTDKPEKVMIMVQKTRECVDGEGDCEAMIDVHLDDFEIGEGEHTIIRKIHCDDHGECEEFGEVHGGSAEVEVVADIHSAGHGKVMIFRTDELDGKVMLRCPEGDSTVTVDQEEANETFLCPKHSVPMEKVSAKKMIKKIRIKEDE